MRMKPIWTFNGEAGVPLATAKQLLLDFREGGFDERSAPLLVAGKGSVKITRDGPRYVVTFTDGHREFVTPEPERNTIAIQGQWWYRGEYTLTAAGNKTHIRLRVFNIAKQAWMASLMNIGAKQKHAAAFDALCKSISG